MLVQAPTHMLLRFAKYDGDDIELKPQLGTELGTFLSEFRLHRQADQLLALLFLVLSQLGQDET